jgi:hypothetical protein
MSNDGEREKGSYEANCSLKHMHFGLRRAAASSESVVARHVFGPEGQFQAQTRNFL